MRNIAIFASGTGTNARKIIEFFRNDDTVRIALVVSNKKDAGVLDIAREHGITALTVDRTTFFQSEALLERLHTQKIDFIVLAGFLWLIPPYLVNAFPRRMINIHPALLPAYGGKGMYGMYVHEAVKAAGDAETGITIHYVNEHYDEGDFVFQTRCPVHP
ncbi:MAG: phosphoribosylglycinamide formyltransferase, partial [Saprospiraceae bacterium]|nr:phosphoribosylglycinamide formyltransferase [Saprospiraceae bacterium]